jgi:hypothetical protein
LNVLTGTCVDILSILGSKKAVSRGLRKSSSLTNGIGPVRNKTALKEYGTEARGLRLSYNSVNASILDTPVNGSL